MRRLVIVLISAAGLAAGLTLAPDASPPDLNAQSPAVEPEQDRRGGRGGRGGGVSIQPGEECPAGMTETRPGTCQAPELPAPSILDYRPRSTLVTAEHLVPKAKYPAVDVHGHGAGNLTSPERLAEFVRQLDSIGVGVFISADNSSGDRLVRALNVIRSSPYADRVRMFTGVNLRNVGPGWAAQAVAQLEADVKAGAVGVGEVGKSFGLSTRKADGSRPVQAKGHSARPSLPDQGRLG